jgi:hypothetical protein
LWDITPAELCDIIEQREISRANDCITVAWFTASYSGAKLKDLDQCLIKPVIPPEPGEYEKSLEFWGLKK